MEDISKVRNHLKLLREEYVKLQQKHSELEKKYNILLANGSVQVDDENTQYSFVGQLVKTVRGLYNQHKFSDVTVKLKSRSIRAHKLILSIRSPSWCSSNLEETAEIDFTNIPESIAEALVQWVYTDDVNLQSELTFLTEFIRCAEKFKLEQLKNKCEQALVAQLTVSNCLYLYQLAEEINAAELHRICSELIAQHWDEFSSDELAALAAPLLLTMLKNRNEFPLHRAIQAKREDVVFLLLVEFDEILSLDLALRSRQESIARSLVSQGANVNRCNMHGQSLLHQSIARQDADAVIFLLQNGADANARSPGEKRTALHLIARMPSIPVGMEAAVKALLASGAFPDHQDSVGDTALLSALQSNNQVLISLLLEHGKQLGLDLSNLRGETALWLALQKKDEQFSLAEKLLQKGSSANWCDPETNTNLVQKAAEAKMEAAAIFLLRQDADVRHVNSKNETALHVACRQSMTALGKELLAKGVDPLGQNEDGETALHMAVRSQNSQLVEMLLSHGNRDMLQVRDKTGETPLGVAVWSRMHNLAIQLLDRGADVNEKDESGFTLLHQALMKQEVESSLFLLSRGASTAQQTPDGFSALQLAVRRHLPQVVEALCEKGVDLNERCAGDCPLWLALDTGQPEMAEILVKFGCDATAWGPGPSDCLQTLLHRAIDESNESAACFLIKSGCDVDSPRKPGPNGERPDEARDLQTPLHLASTWTMEMAVQALMERGAQVNAQDAESETPLHMAIANQNQRIVALLLSHPEVNLSLRNKRGQTPFAAAMAMRDHKSAKAVLDRHPAAANQVDSKGRNLLHVAVQSGDLESILFLLGVGVDVNCPIGDSQKLTPLHLAVSNKSEIVVRNLLLAGARVDAVTNQLQTPLHLCCELDQASICAVLLENGTNPDAADMHGNNAFHLAVQAGQLAVVRALLESDSRVDVHRINAKGQSPLHMLAIYGRDSAAAILELLLQYYPDYPLDRPDAHGSTALLLAYQQGNAALCRSLVRAGACLASTNREGVSIFNHAVATKQLLFRLLDLLSKEPPWTDSDACMECATRFNLKTRKHHCRHCGRILCSKCSDRDVPILKFNLSKPVRICNMCFEVIQLGGNV